jgi:hypothetical protein
MIGLAFLIIFAIVVLWLLFVTPDIVICFLLPGAFMLWMMMGFP